MMTVILQWPKKQEPIIITENDIYLGATYA